jgi:isopenicillin N synthase-like dioxygenase
LPFFYITDARIIFHLFNNTHFLVREIFILDIEKKASHSSSWFVFCITAIVKHLLEGSLDFLMTFVPAQVRMWVVAVPGQAGRAVLGHQAS